MRRTLNFSESESKAKDSIRSCENLLDQLDDDFLSNQRTYSADRKKCEETVREVKNHIHSNIELIRKCSDLQEEISSFFREYQEKLGEIDKDCIVQLVSWCELLVDAVNVPPYSCGKTLIGVHYVCNNLCTVLKRIVKSHRAPAATIENTINNAITATAGGIIIGSGIASGPNSKNDVKLDANEFKKTADKVVQGSNECHNIVNRSWSSWEGGSVVKISLFFSAAIAASFGVWAHLDPTFKFSLFDFKLPSFVESTFSSIGNIFKKSDGKQLK